MPVERYARSRAAADSWRAFELRAGTRWTTWLGAAALVLGAALFIRLAIEHGWLGPIGRLALGVAAGFGLLGAGWRAQRSMRVLAHGLFGAGLGVIYISLYVASATHALLAPELAFGAMVAVTVVGSGLALAQESQALAVLAWLGGLATPLLVPDVGTRDMTSAYVLVLAVAGTATAAVRGWRVLATIAVAGTHVALIASLAHRRTSDDWERELAWFAISHAAIVVTPIAIAVRRRALAPMWAQLACLSTVVAIGAALVIPAGHSHVLGIYTLLFAVGHASLAYVVRRVATDNASRIAFPAIAIAFATATFPLLVPGALTTVAWSIEALVILELAADPRDRTLRIIALALVGVAGVHAFAGAFAPQLGVARIAIVAVPPAAWAYAFLHHRQHAVRASERWLTVVAAFGGTALALVAGDAELLHLLGPAASRDLAPAWWAIGSLAIALAASRTRTGPIAATVTAAIAAWLAFVAYRDGAATTTIIVNLRCGAAVLALGALAASRGPSVALPRAAALVGLVVLVRAEVADETTLSLAWSALGALLLAIGFVAAQRHLRLAGLALLALVTTKIMLVDLAGASSLLRVLSLVVLGTVLIAASFAYHRLTARDSA